MTGEIKQMWTWVCTGAWHRLWCHTPWAMLTSPARMAWLQTQAPRTMNDRTVMTGEEGRSPWFWPGFQPPCSHKRPSWWVRSPWGKTGHKTVSRSWPLTCISSTTSKKPAEPTPVLESFADTNSEWLTKIWTWFGYIWELQVPSLPPFSLSIYHLYWWFSNFQSATHSKEPS